MKERDYGREYAKSLGGSESVDIDRMVHTSRDIPPDDYAYMKKDGIENPDAREYWAGYNEFVENKKTKK